MVALRFFRLFFFWSRLAGFRRDRLPFAVGRDRADRLVSDDFGDGAIYHSLAERFYRQTNEVLRVGSRGQSGTQLGRVGGRKCTDFIGCGKHLCEQSLMPGRLRLALRGKPLEQQVTRLFKLQDIFPAAIERSFAHFRRQLMEFRIHRYRLYELSANGITRALL